MFTKLFSERFGRHYHNQEAIDDRMQGIFHGGKRSDISIRSSSLQAHTSRIVLEELMDSERTRLELFKRRVIHGAAAADPRRLRHAAECEINQFSLSQLQRFPSRRPLCLCHALSFVCEVARAC